MKYATKAAALLLAVVMLLTLCACGKNKDKEKPIPAAELIGEWEATLDVYALASVMGNESFAQLADIGLSLGKCSLTFVFTEKQVTIQTDGMLDWYEDYLYAIMDWVQDDDNAVAFFAMTYGYETEEFRAMIEADGVTVDSLREEIADLDVAAALTEMADEMADMTADYTLNGTSLIFDESEWIYSYSDGAVTVRKILSDTGTTVLNAGDFVLTKK